jgi:hypothetical protein
VAQNKISVLIDVTVDKAQASLKSFRTSIAEADGAAGKLKAGFAGAMGAVKANAGTAALAAGTALVAFGVKAAGAFTDVALAADDAAKATGLTVDQASRFIAVGDDYGITADDIAKGLGKVTTSLDAAKWEKYGIATRDAAGVARDANSIILDTFDALSKETNATERANMAKELLGKGYATLGPLIGKTREELEGYLGAVSDSQVITAKEAEKARKLALAQDALADAYLDVQLAVGSLAAELAPLIENTADMASKAAELADKLGPLPEIMLGIVSPVTALDRVMGLFVDHVDLSTISLDDYRARLESAGFTTEQIATATAEWIEANTQAAVAVDQSSGSVDEYQRRLAGLEYALDQNIVRQQEYAAAIEGFDAYNAVQADIKDFVAAVDSGTLSAADQSTVLAVLKGKLLQYAQSIEDIPDEKRSEITAAIGMGDVERANDLLNQVARTRVAKVIISILGPGAVAKGVAAGAAAGIKDINAAIKAAEGVLSGGGGGGGGGGGSAPRTAEEVMADWDAIIATLYEQGEWDVAQYRAHLEQRLGAYAKYSDDYNRVWRELRSLDEQAADEAAKRAEAEKRAAEERAEAEKRAAEEAARAAEEAAEAERDKVDAMYELGEMSRDQYRAQLVARLAGFAKYSDDYMRVVRQIGAIDKEAADEKKAAEDAASQAERDRLDAEKTAAEDAKRAAEEAQRAQDDALNRAAMQSIVAANIGGATYATINTAADPNAVINAIQQYERRNGPGWRR